MTNHNNHFNIECELCGNHDFYEYPYPMDVSPIRNKIIKDFFRRLFINPAKVIMRIICSVLPKSCCKALRTRAWSPYKKIKSPSETMRSLRKLSKGVLLFEGRTIIICTQCTLGVVSPAIAEGQLVKFYEEDYWISDSGEVEPAENNRTISTYNLLKNYINFTELNRALEFGSASAHFARFFKSKESRLQFDIVDPGARWQEALKGSVNTIYNNINKINKTYDIIVSSHALEHIPNLNSYFKYFYALLNDGGYLYFEVPNSEEFDVIFGDDPDYHFPHTYFFTQAAFERIAEKFNLEIIFSKTFSRSYSERKYGTKPQTLSSEENPKGAYLRILFKKKK